MYAKVSFLRAHQGDDEGGGGEGGGDGAAPNDS